ncbi:GNAT family N-acetyltransferase [Streptomyces abikoensis]|uniref:GNAT family N-acetyltransferase n=1 Tax=Streptomyces abikoensis TaxID=97398 RepID=UPI003F4CD3F4
MATDPRVLRPADWDHWYGTLEPAFDGVPEAPEERTPWREPTRFDRSIGAWDGPVAVGSAGSFAFRMAVPGGSPAPAAGATMVGVRPTHRRQGVLTSMMWHLLEDVRERREPPAAPTASEPGIHGRFGYGIATHRIHARVDTLRVRLVIPEDPSATDSSYATDGVRIRLSAPEDARAACEEVYARRVTTRPGVLRRCDVQMADQPHLRLVDVGDALAARTYAAPVDVVLDVTDAFCPWNTGRRRRRRPALSARSRLGCRTGSDGLSPYGGHACWQDGHQKRLRAARSAVRIAPPQTRHGRSALR